MSSENSANHSHGHGHDHHHNHHHHHDNPHGLSEELLEQRNKIHHIQRMEGAEKLMGAGNSKVISELKEGQCVLDLGSGYGHDCIKAAKQVGPSGLVIGIDNNAETIAEAEENVRKNELSNVQFKKGQIEEIPVADGTVDVVISTFALNHASNKSQMFKEAARVLKEGGLVAIADVVQTKKLPDEMVQELTKMGTCTAHAALVDDLKTLVSAAGFRDVNIEGNEASRPMIEKMFPVKGIHEYIVSANITARKM